MFLADEVTDGRFESTQSTPDLTLLGSVFGR
jgi:hypothetical protein